MSLFKYIHFFSTIFQDKWAFDLQKKIRNFLFTCSWNAQSASFWGSVTYFQSSGVLGSQRWNQGTLTFDGCSPPASSKRIRQSETSDNLAAKTEPAVPPPTAKVHLLATKKTNATLFKFYRDDALQGKLLFINNVWTQRKQKKFWVTLKWGKIGKKKL